MSYTKMMKFNKKHPKGTHQVCLMHTESGFTPSNSFLGKYFEYRKQSEVIGREPIGCEDYYNTPAFLRKNLLQTEVLNAGTNPNN